MRLLIALALIVVLSTAAYGSEKKAFQMREDFGTEPVSDCYMNYYYYIPNPASSWFWNFGWCDLVLGEWFEIGEPSMGIAGSGCPPYSGCDPCNAHTIEQFRVLDFVGYGTAYPGALTVNFKIWCSDERGCPVGAALWSSGPTELCNVGWNYIPVIPNLCVSSCFTQLQGGLRCYPRVLITAQGVGTLGVITCAVTDNTETPINRGCQMHDIGCCPALYPRPQVSYYRTIHSGDYGIYGTHCPPYWILNPDDSVGNVYGYLELAWRLYLRNTGPTANEPSTWGKIKSIYK